MTAVYDRSFVYLWCVLVAIGVLAVCSVTVHVEGTWFNQLFLRHLIYVVLSGVVFVVAYQIPLERCQQFHRVFWLVALVLSAVVLLPGVANEVGGAKRWIDFGFFTIQVSEWVKPLLIVYAAGYLAANYKTVQRSLLPLVVMLTAVGMVLALVFIEPDYGTVAIVGLVAISMLFLANARLSHLIVLGGTACCGLAALLVLEPYRVARLTTLMSPWDRDTEFTSGYQLTNSLISFGRGEWAGTGLGTGLQKTFTPASHNDFIFATIAEETGIIGSIVVLLLISVLVYRCFSIARTCLEKNSWHFEGFLCYGVGLLIAYQTIIHVGVNVGALPTKGLTLPFISFGGNSLVILTGLVAMVARVDSNLQTSRQHDSL